MIEINKFRPSKTCQVHGNRCFSNWFVLTHAFYSSYCRQFSSALTSIKKCNTWTSRLSRRNASKKEKKIINAILFVIYAHRTLLAGWTDDGREKWLNATALCVRGRFTCMYTYIYIHSIIIVLWWSHIWKILGKLDLNSQEDRANVFFFLRFYAFDGIKTYYLIHNWLSPRKIWQTSVYIYIVVKR